MLKTQWKLKALNWSSVWIGCLLECIFLWPTICQQLPLQSVSWQNQNFQTIGLDIQPLCLTVDPRYSKLYAPTGANIVRYSTAYCPSGSCNPLTKEITISTHLSRYYVSALAVDKNSNLWYMDIYANTLGCITNPYGSSQTIYTTTGFGSGEDYLVVGMAFNTGTNELYIGYMENIKSPGGVWYYQVSGTTASNGQDFTSSVGGIFSGYNPGFVSQGTNRMMYLPWSANGDYQVAASTNIANPFWSSSMSSVTLFCLTGDSAGNLYGTADSGAFIWKTESNPTSPPSPTEIANGGAGQGCVFDPISCMLYMTSGTQSHLIAYQGNCSYQPTPSPSLSPSPSLLASHTASPSSSFTPSRSPSPSLTPSMSASCMLSCYNGHMGGSSCSCQCVDGFWGSLCEKTLCVKYRCMDKTHAGLCVNDTSQCCGGTCLENSTIDVQATLDISTTNDPTIDVSSTDSNNLFTWSSVTNGNVCGKSNETNGLLRISMTNLNRTVTTSNSSRIVSPFWNVSCAGFQQNFVGGLTMWIPITDQTLLSESKEISWASFCLVEGSDINTCIVKAVVNPTVQPLRAMAIVSVGGTYAVSLTNLVLIVPRGSSSSTSVLVTGGIAAGAVSGVVILFCIIFVAILLIVRRWKMKKTQKELQSMYKVHPMGQKTYPMFIDSATITTTQPTSAWTEWDNTLVPPLEMNALPSSKVVDVKAFTNL
jgi:hypothetical protein